MSTLLLSLLRNLRLETLEFGLVFKLSGWSGRPYRSDLFKCADHADHLLRQAKIMSLNTNYELLQKLECVLGQFMAGIIRPCASCLYALLSRLW